MHRIAYSRLRFLVASADIVTRDTLRVMLQAFGAKAVIEAQDGFEALDAFSSLEPDIVFADRDMPLVNGLEMTRLLRLTEFTGGQTGNPYAPVVLLTRDLQRDDIREASDAGATEYCVKPITSEAIYKLVEGVVLDPRPFIQLGSYFGPDRRRNGENVAGERRQRKSEPDARRIIETLQGPTVEEVFGDHVVVRPPNALSRKAALPQTDALETPEAVMERAEKALAALQAGYRSRMTSDVQALEVACEAFLTRPSIASSRQTLVLAVREARQRAKDFGFVLAERVAGGLEELLSSPTIDSAAVRALECHVEALGAITRAVGSNQDDALIDTMVQHLGTLNRQMNPAVQQVEGKRASA